MRVLVTGATGKVGSRVVPRLLERGHAVHALVRRPAAGEALRSAGAEVVLGDLREAKSLRAAVVGVEAVLHFAAFFRGATEAEVREVIVDGSVELAGACVAAGVPRLLFASTNLVYGPSCGCPAREDDPVAPSGAYPAAKAEAERALLAIRSLDVQVLRLAFVYGEGDAHLADALPFWRKMLPSERIQLVHHVDVAQAFTLALEAGGRGGRVYNVADDRPTTVAEIMETLGERPSPEAQAPAGAWGGIVDTGRIRGQLGFRPTFPTLQSAREAAAL